MAGGVILVEGLDLAGKSTLVKNLKEELARRGVPVRASRNSLCPDNPIAALADQVRRDPHASLAETGALFLAAHLWDARHFTPPPDRTVHLQDSCWLRTLAYHTFHGTPGVPGLLREAMASFPRFDAAVFLTASVEERQRRLAQREREQPGVNDANDHRVLTDPAGYLLLERTLKGLTAQCVTAKVIETTAMEEAALVQLMLETVFGI